MLNSLLNKKVKKYFLLLLLFFSCLKFSSAQILCIYCYDQNDTISANVNNLILNGGFENTTCFPWPPLVTFCPNSTSYPLCNVTNWICSGGGTGTYACIVDSIQQTNIVEGVYGAYFGNSYCKACSVLSNDTSCLNNAGCTVIDVPPGYPLSNPQFGGSAGVSLEQAVTGLATGNAYVLEFWAGGEFHPSMFTSGLFAVDVGFGDTLLKNNATAPGIGIGTRYIIEFIATSTSHTIKFTNWGHICQNCTELVIDDVRLYTLAELDASVPHCTLGIDASSASGGLTNVFPNPFTNQLTIKTNSNELSEIIIYDIASRKLLQQTFINSAFVNTEELSKGIYFYEIKNKDSLVKKGKVVKE